MGVIILKPNSVMIAKALLEVMNCTTNITVYYTQIFRVTNWWKQARILILFLEEKEKSEMIKNP